MVRDIAHGREVIVGNCSSLKNDWYNPQKSFRNLTNNCIITVDGPYSIGTIRVMLIVV